MKNFSSWNELFIRNLSAGELLEDFLITAVSTIVVVRLFLYAVDFPQIGGWGFHIAHMLFGGIFLVIALIMTLSFLDNKTKEIASIIGGVGFGLFIDELGKFITQDNNYFFEPTFALIYVVFIMLFMSIRATERYFKITPSGYAVNALEIVKDVLMFDLDRQEKQIALAYLKKAESDNPIVKAMIQLLQSTRAQKSEKLHVVDRLRLNVSDYYYGVVRSPNYSNILVVFFVLQSIWNLGQAIFLFHSIDSFNEIGLLISTLMSGFFVLLGTFNLLKRDRRGAYQMYRYAILISIFLTQFFLFYEEQLSALFHLVWNVTIYLSLRFLITQEDQLVHNQRISISNSSQ